MDSKEILQRLGKGDVVDWKEVSHVTRLIDSPVLKQKVYKQYFKNNFKAWEVKQDPMVQAALKAFPDSKVTHV